MHEGGGQRISEVLAAPYNGPQYRITIAPLLDHSSGRQSINGQLGLLAGTGEPPTAGEILGGIGELLTTALFSSGRFIILEREGLNEVMAEQAFSRDKEALTPTQQTTLEGAEFLLLGAVTAFDMGESGGVAFPIPIPLGDRGDFGMLDVEMRTAYAAMDLRIVEVASGRVVAATAVEGRARKVGLGLAAIYTVGGGQLHLPGLLNLFSNTPLERALMEMAGAATQSLVDSLFPEAAAERHEREQRALEELLP